MLKLGRFDNPIDFYELQDIIEGTLYKSTRDSGFTLGHVRFSKNTEDRHLGGHNASSDFNGTGIGFIALSGDHKKFDEQSLKETFDMYANSKALIIDLTAVDEGGVELVQKLLGLFIDPKKTVAQLKYGDHSQALKPTSIANIKPFKPDFPVYIVHSAFVTGAWEMFSFVMQQNNKAVIVGELSMGVGFIDIKRQVSDKLFLSMTQAQFVPVNSNSSKHSSQDGSSYRAVGWNELGVIPDYPTKRDEALEKAYQLALSQINHKL